MKCSFCQPRRCGQLFDPSQVSGVSRQVHSKHCICLPRGQLEIRQRGPQLKKGDLTSRVAVSYTACTQVTICLQFNTGSSRLQFNKCGCLKRGHPRLHGFEREKNEALAVSLVRSLEASAFVHPFHSSMFDPLYNIPSIPCIIRNNAYHASSPKKKLM